jgi:hypothetical protein
MKYDVEIIFKVKRLTAKNLNDSIESISRISALSFGSELDSFHLNIESVESDKPQAEERDSNSACGPAA